MPFHLYAGQGAWLLVPDCMQVSLDAAARYGPLVHLGVFDSDLLTPDEVREIIAAFEAVSYAQIDEALVHRLQAPARCPVT